ncbi:siderophore-related non-ribosomal peptide synthase [Burkholderia pseudomallei]|nr:siderophore-related non-ribosomal peptide synthase [Burkholderia pseudomallei]
MALDAHATLPMLLHAALNAAFYRATGATDQPVGVLASTRELTGDAAERALGLFINAVVVRTRLSGTCGRRAPPRATGRGSRSTRSTMSGTASCSSSSSTSSSIRTAA